jgi:triosephosphate isomerase
MRQLIAGNWKMNGLLGGGRALAQGVRDGAAGLGCDVLLCPPATLLTTVAAIVDGSAVMLGGQDCHEVASGAHTGDISAPMLADLGLTWVILGHSERRAAHGETDALVRAKAQAAAGAGLRAIICVGETEAQRTAGQATTVVGAQLAASLPEDFAGVVAYEPIWAIGTGRTATSADVAEMHGFLRAALISRLGPAGAATRILYGGSVNAENAATLLAVPEVGGALVGGASLGAESFLAIARAAK